MHRKHKIAVLVAAVIAPVVALVPAGTASAHGYVSDVPSRAANCARGVVTGCGAIQYEPQSVEAPKGFPQAGPADGDICAGGNPQFAELDDPRGGSWPAAGVSAGQQTFTWTVKANHATDKWEYFITRDGWNPSQPLTRADLESAPIFEQYDGGAQPPSTVRHSVDLPGKTGRHLILGVWTIADTGNAFYSCIDVDFDGGGDPPPTDPPPTEPPGDCAAPAWDSGTVYTGGDRVSHNGAEWEAQWWTQGEEPGTTGEWGVWREAGPCDGGSTPPPDDPSEPPPSDDPTDPPSDGTWTAGTAYAVGDTVTYNGITYTCRQSHTAQVGWEPPNTPALWQAQ